MTACAMCREHGKGDDECRKQLEADVSLLSSSHFHVSGKKQDLTPEDIHAFAGVVRALMLKRYREQQSRST